MGKLLEGSVRHGTAVLGTLVKQALERHGESLAKAKRLFTDEERHQLAEQIAATRATANLMGRARIRLRMQQSKKHHETGSAEKFSDQPTSFAVFKSERDKAPDTPMAPEKALAYFRSLVPGISGDPQRFGDQMRRHAFTLAATADEALLERVQNVIADMVESGEAPAGGQAVQQILDRAGVTPKNPQYADMVFRTNVKDQYNVGADEERQDPEVAEYFPAWKYLGIADGRQRPQHFVHFNQYFPNALTFAEVRDSEYGGAYSGFN